MGEEKNYTVYMHVCKENGKTYIGLTKMKLEDRWKNGRGYREQLFGRAIEKYGWDNFEHIILFENKSKKEAEELEVLYIKILLSNNSIYGYNIDNGGNSPEKMTDGTRKKLSESHKGQKAWNKGMKSLLARGNHPQAKKVICDDMVFDCARDCADYYNIKHKIFNSWLTGKVALPQEFYSKGLKYMDSDNELKLHIPLSKGNNPNARKVICDNIEFDSVESCAEYYNLKSSVMSGWLRKDRGAPEEFVNLGLRYKDGDTVLKIQKEFKRKVICENKVFDSITECAKFYNIEPHNMADWLNGRLKMRKDFYDKGLRLFNDNTEIQVQNKYHKFRNVICDDVIFDSIKDCAEYYVINVGTMSCWLTGQNPIPQRFINLGLRYMGDDTTVYKSQTKQRKRKIICNNLIFETIKECAKYYDIKYTTMVSWLKDQNPMPQNFIDLGLRYYTEENENIEKSA